MGSLVTVIIPVYNVEKYLDTCICSVLQQTYENWELILVDDGSTDHSPQICDNYANSDVRITVYHNSNYGASYSRNFGIDRSQGKYLTFIDSDDWIGKNYLSNLVQAIEQTDSDLAISSYYLEYADRSVLDSVDKRQLTGVLAKDLVKLYRLTAGPCYKLYCRDVIRTKGIRFPLGRSYSEDRVFNYKYLRSIRRYCYIDTPQYHYRQWGDSSLSKQRSMKAFDDALYALKEEKEFLQAMHASGKYEMLYMSTIDYLGAFRETNETGDSYEAYCERFRQVKEIVPVAYSIRSLKRLVASCAYILTMPYIFYIWHTLKKHFKYLNKNLKWGGNS